jgi:hypothetical protein
VALLVASCGETTNATNAPGVSSTPGAAFVLEEGFEHDVCGIGITVKFIPATSTSSTFGEAVLQWGPVSNVVDNVQNHTGDQPLPANAAQLSVGATVNLSGHGFKVDAIDIAKTKVTLEPAC